MLNTRKSTPSYFIFKLLINHRQRENLERNQKKKSPYIQRNKDKNYIGLLFRNHANKKSRVKYLKCSEEKKIHQLRILYPAKFSFKSEREIKTFLDKQKVREFVTYLAKNVKINYTERRQIIL